MKMEKYFFADSDQRPVLDTSGKVRLMGRAYGRKGFEDGTTVATSSIENLTETTAETASGSIYELGSMNTEYVEMIESDKAGMPVIFDWDLKKDTLLDNLPNPDQELGDPFSLDVHDGHVLYGKTQHGEPIVGEVINQDGNFVTLRTVDIESLTEKEERCFVVWPDISNKALFGIKLLGELAGIPYDLFETSFFLKCRPRIPLAE